MIFLLAGLQDGGVRNIFLPPECKNRKSNAYVVDCFYAKMGTGLGYIWSRPCIRLILPSGCLLRDARVQTVILLPDRGLILMLQNRLLELVREIEDMKAQLVTLFETKSCSLQGAVLQKSQELDLLIVQYYRLLRGERAAGGSRLQPRPIRNRR